jgi:hypothetical protein
VSNHMSIILCAAGLVVAAAAGFFAQNRRGVFLLGRHGPALALPALVIVWFAGLTLGQLTGSLAGMSLTAAAIMTIVAAFASRTPMRRLRTSWTRLHLYELGAWAFITGIILVNVHRDELKHNAIMGMFLRGNIPPHALNDPDQLITYHVVFDGGAAVVTRALHLDLELARDLLSSLLVLAVLPCVRVLGQLLLRTRAARIVGTLFFLFGLGPTFIRAMLHGDVYRLHGATTQAYVDAILRRPTALGFVLFTFALTVLLARVPRRQTKFATRFLPHPAWLLPVAYLMPLASEELGILLVPTAMLACVLGALPIGWMLATTIALGLGASCSGVVYAMLNGGASTEHPHIALAWPPTLPTWNAPALGVPLLSIQAAWSIGSEFGPLFLAGLLAAVLLRGPTNDRVRGSVAIVPFVIGFSCAIIFDLGSWPKSDLDRFMFYGTPVVFMISARVIDLMADVPNPVCISRTRMLHAGTVAIALMVVAGPVVFAIVDAYRNQRPWDFLPESPGRSLRQNLADVGPREPILTDKPGIAYELALAGFTVIAPMQSSRAGEVTFNGFDDWARRFSTEATWYLLPAYDVRVRDRPITVRAMDRVLVRIATQPGTRAAARPRD